VVVDLDDPRQRARVENRRPGLADAFRVPPTTYTAAERLSLVHAPRRGYLGGSDRA
jgi:hypothetical protein